MPSASPAARARRSPARVGNVYLLHFSRPYWHARHYLGFADDIDRRLALHRRGKAAVLTRAVVAVGIEIFLARQWGDVTRVFERRAHHFRGRRICPICRGPRAYRECAPRRDPVTGIGI